MNPVNPQPLSPDQFSMLLVGLLARLLGPVKETKETSLAQHIFVPPETTAGEGRRLEFHRAVRILASLLSETPSSTQQPLPNQIQPRSFGPPSIPSAISPVAPPQVSLAQVREAVQTLTQLVLNDENTSLVPPKLRPTIELLIRAVQEKTLDFSNEKSPPFTPHITTLNPKNTPPRPIPPPPSTAAPLSERHRVSPERPSQSAPTQPSPGRPAPSAPVHPQPSSSPTPLKSHTPMSRSLQTPSSTSLEFDPPIPSRDAPTPLNSRAAPSPRHTVSEPPRPLPQTPPPPPSLPQTAPKIPTPVPTTSPPATIGAGPFTISPLTPLSPSKKKKKCPEESDNDPDEDKQER
jgi:hypothetical protein